MLMDYEYAWAVPKDTNPEILVKRASMATQAMVRLRRSRFSS